MIKPVITLKLQIPELDFICAVDSVYNGDVVLANSLLKNSESTLVFSNIETNTIDDGENSGLMDQNFFFCDELINEDRFDAV